MKRIQTTGMALCLLAVFSYGQRALPELEDPAFEAVSTAYRVEYHYNKHTYTLYMPDADSPNVFKLKFPFFTTQRTTVTFGKVEREVVKRKFDLTNVMNGKMYKVDTAVGETEIGKLFYVPDAGRLAIVIRDKDTEEDAGIFYPDGENPETVFRGILEGKTYTFVDKSRERFGVLAGMINDDIMIRRCRAIEKEGQVIAQYIKDRMRGSKIPFDLYIKNGLNHEEIAEMITLFICSHQLMLAFADADER